MTLALLIAMTATAVMAQETIETDQQLPELNAPVLTAPELNEPAPVAADPPAPQPQLSLMSPAPKQQSAIRLNTPSVTVGDQPVNSTLKMRVARRPWLLEKLTGPRKEPSIKMDPPRPPRDRAFDPPSITTIPIDPRQPLPDKGIWVLRNAEPAPAKSEPAPAKSEPAPAKSEPAPAKSEPKQQESRTESKPAAKTAPPQPADSENLELRPADPQKKVAEPQPDKASITPEAKPDAGSKESRENDSEPQPIGQSEKKADGNGSLRPNPNATSKTIRKPEIKSDPETGLVPRKAPVVRELTVDPPSLQDPPKAEPIGGASKTPNRGDSAKTNRGAENQESSRPSGAASKYVGTEPAEETRPEVKLDYTGYPMRSLRLNSSVRSMQRPMRSCLQYYFNRPEIADERSNWGMLHQIMVYGVDTRVIVGRKRYSAIAWIAGNNACRGQRLLINGEQGIEARSGVGLQGHQSQMLAVFALCGVPSDYPLYAGSEKYTVGDVVRAEMATCRRGAELTFTLIALSHYIDTDAVWLADDGQQWDFERLIREELNQPIVGAACGGTHRLMGFAHALRKRRAAGKPIVGQWKRAELFTLDFQSYCYRLQNSDGSMSTDWFEGREDNGELDRKIQTTGHMVEWLLTITPDSQLQNPRLVKAVRFLLNSMLGERGHDWKIGPKGHALRSLAMYYERVYRSGPAWRTPGMAQSGDASYR